MRWSDSAQWQWAVLKCNRAFKKLGLGGGGKVVRTVGGLAFERLKAVAMET